MKKKMDAFESLVEFSKTANLKHLRDVAKDVSTFNMEAIDKADEPCGTCLFNAGRVGGVKSLFTEDTLGPSHCFLSNVLGAARKYADAKEKPDEWAVDCYGPQRENWIKTSSPGTAKDRGVKLSSMEDAVFDEMFDQAKIFTELVKFVNAIEALAENKETKEE